MWSGFVGIKFVIAVVVIAAVSWGLSNKLIGKEHLERDYQLRAAKDYLNRAIPKIIGNWDFMAFKERTAGELHVSENWPAVPGKFKLYQKNLGKPINYGALEGAVELDTNFGRDIVTGAFVQRVGFEKATGDVNVSVVKRNGNWKITRLSIRSTVVPADLDDDQ